MIYIIFQLFFFIIISVIFKKKFISFLWLFFSAIILYFIIHYVLPLPEGFNDDEFVYLELLNEGDISRMKTFFHNFFKPSFFLDDKIIIEFVRFFLGISNFYLIFLLFDRGLDNYKMILFLVLCSGYSLHVFTFLREPFLYFFITIFLYFLIKNKFLISSLFLILIGLARLDSLIYVLPFWFIILSVRFNFKYIFNILVILYLTMYWLMFFGPLSVYTEPYIRAFSILNDLESENTLIQNITDVIIPSLSIAKILFQIQLIGGLYYIYRLKSNQYLYKSCIFIYLFTLLILLSISNNYGWLLRLTSGMILMFYIILTNYENSKQKLNAT